MLLVARITHTQGYPTVLLPWDRDDTVELYFVNRVKEATFIKVSLHTTAC